MDGFSPLFMPTFHGWVILTLYFFLPAILWTCFCMWFVGVVSRVLRRGWRALWHQTDSSEPTA